MAQLLWSLLLRHGHTVSESVSYSSVLSVFSMDISFFHLSLIPLVLEIPRTKFKEIETQINFQEEFQSFLRSNVIPD